MIFRWNIRHPSLSLVACWWYLLGDLLLLVSGNSLRFDYLDRVLLNRLRSPREHSSSHWRSDTVLTIELL